MNKGKRYFVVCLSNRGYAASLEARKIYVALVDAKAAADGFVRVVDESGEDYLYPKARFEPIKVSRRVEQAVAAG